MNRRIFSIERAPQAIGPYSQAIIYNDLLFVSGQGPVTPSARKVIDSTLQGQTRQILCNLRTIIEDAGFSMENVLKVTAYLADINDFPAFNKVYQEFFGTSRPARACIQAGKLPGQWKAEIDAIVGRGG